MADGTVVGHDTLATDLAALLAGSGFVDLSDHRKLRVAGTDAAPWLHDLLTADIAGLASGSARRSLLLTPTGHVRADVHVVRRADDVVVLPDLRQPEAVGDALAPYVLSSDVRLDDVSAELAILAVPGSAVAPASVPTSAPSAIGAGVDVIVDAGDTTSVRAELAANGLREVHRTAADAWRVVRAVPTMGPDFDRRSLPAEAGLDELIDTTKGCFLGQESVARVRNLGHPPRVLRHVRGTRSLAPRDHVRDGDAIVGEVTSAVPFGGAWIAFVRVAWSAATARLTDSDGNLLHDADPSG